MTELISGTSFSIVFIPTKKVQEVFPLVESEIEKTLIKAENGFDHNDILKMLNDGEMNLWIVFDTKKKQKVAFIITEIIDRPQFRFINTFMATGRDKDSWETESRKIIEKFAIKNGCTKAMLLARKGWSKSFKKTGYRETHTFLEKQLINK